MKKSKSNLLKLTQEQRDKKINYFKSKAVEKDRTKAEYYQKLSEIAKSNFRKKLGVHDRLDEERFIENEEFSNTKNERRKSFASDAV